MIVKTIIITMVLIAFLLLLALFVMKNKIIIEKYKIFKLKTLLITNKKEEAKKYAIKIVDKYPNNCIVHKILGELYEKERQINAALAEYIKVVELDEKNYEMQYKVATLLYKTEKNEEAVIMLKDLLKIKPEYLEASLLLGNILYEDERFKEAISVYMSALKYHPTEYELYYNIGMVFTRLNDFQRAKEYYKKAAELNTYLYNGQYDLALIEMIQGELDEAQRYFQNSIQMEELEAVSYFYLAQISLMKGENETALNYINLALELDRNIEKKIIEQPLFAVIQDRIRVPNETRKIKVSLSTKEVKTNRYLEKMYSLVDSLNGGKSAGNENGAKKEEKQIENEKERE